MQGLWYKNITYEDAVELAKENLTGMVETFIAAGYYLKVMQAEFGQHGYKTIWECAEAELGLKKSEASRAMSMNSKYSVDGNTPYIQERYKQYSKSQLQEMLKMPEEQIELVPPDMKVREIREMKRPALEEKRDDELLQAMEQTGDETGTEVCCDIATEQVNTGLGDDGPESIVTEIETDGDGVSVEFDTDELLRDLDDVIDTECREVEVAGDGSIATPQEPELTRPDRRQREYLKAFARYFISCESGWMYGDYTSRVLDVTRSPEEIKAHLGLAHRCWHFKINGSVASINLFDGYIQLWDENSCCMGNFEWFYLAAAIQSMWDVVALEKAGAVLAGDGEPQEEETESEDTEGQAPVNELQRLRDILKKEDGTLREYLEVDGLPEPMVYRQKTIVCALGNMLCELEGMEEKEEGAAEVQQGFPALKNNTERKQWLSNYKAWGLWYRDRNIDVNYYKFDFPDGSRLVAAEYPQRHVYWKDGRKDEYYFHLLEKNKQGYKKQYDEQYRQQTDSETYLVEFLKNVQKKGSVTLNE